MLDFHPLRENLTKNRHAKRGVPVRTRTISLLKCLAAFSVLGSVGAADLFTTPAPSVLQPPPPPSPSPSPPPLNQSPIPIVNCDVDGPGPVPDEYIVHLKPQHPSHSEGRRLDTREDKLSYLKSFVHRYDLEDDTSNGSNRRKLDADSEPAVHYFTEMLAVAIHTSEEVQ